MSTVPTRSIVVTGMTCHHRACAVRTEISMLLFVHRIGPGNQAPDTGWMGLSTAKSGL